MGSSLISGSRSSDRNDNLEATTSMTNANIRTDVDGSHALSKGGSWDNCLPDDQAYQSTDLDMDHMVNEAQEHKKKRWVAVLMSIILPGFGHLYINRIGTWIVILTIEMMMLTMALLLPLTGCGWYCLDRSKYPATGPRKKGLTNQGPLQKPGLSTAKSGGRRGH